MNLALFQSKKLITFTTELHICITYVMRIVCVCVLKVILLMIFLIIIQK